MLRTRVRAGPVASLVLSVVFAVLFTGLSCFDLFIDSWSPQLGQATRVALRIPHGSRIVVRGEEGDSRMVYQTRRVTIPPFIVLDETKDDHREAFAYESLRRPPKPIRLAGYLVIYGTLSFMLSSYMRRLGQSRVRLLRTHIGVFSLIFLMTAVAKGLLLFTQLPEYWVPVGTVSIWVAMGFDRRTAMLVNLMMAFVAASLLRFDLLFLTVVLVRGMMITLLLFNRRKPRQLMLAGTIAGVATAVSYIAMDVVFEGTFHPIADLSLLLDSRLLACVGGGALCGLISSVLRDPAERLLGQVPRDKLLDLTDIESPLLKKLSEEAPGTWEHSRAMANLAEAAAAAIGADPLLTRVGAYYHDVGKTIQPKYFVENQSPGEPSPHEGLEPEVSADAIMAHVVLGTRMLREAGIPEPVVEFAYTHHGTQLVEYFWNKYLEQNGLKDGAATPASDKPAPRTEDHFRYPGMKPQTKETAILMLVDSVEAASRTVSPPEYDKFEEMIRRVVFYKLASGQLDDCGLRMDDLRTLIQRLATTLVNVYHARIKYPWQRQQEHLPAQSYTTPPPQPVVPLAVSPPAPPAEDTIAKRGN
ncbi:MAG: HDIG domain-containing protein [Deltaproteobacteria bacterium]|nr:HDIG domain-containing protein [Deltaproteobacteria bacterium]